MSKMPEGTPTEIIDFASITSLPRHIEITHRMTFGAVTIGRYLLTPHAGAAIGATQYVVLVHEGGPFEMQWLVPGSNHLEHKLILPGDIYIFPSDTLVYKRWRATSRMLFMAIDRAFIEQVVADVFGQRAIRLAPKIGINDPVIEGMAGAWREELHERGAGGRIHAEALAIALIVHLIRTYGGASTEVLSCNNGVSATRLKPVIDYIEFYLNENINLSVLADVAGLSVHYFNEVFKVVTGLAPHQFVVERRVHRAKEFLLGTDMSIAEIAVEVGFSSQSHLTLNFRKLTATTPLRFRVAGTRSSNLTTDLRRQ